MIEYLNTHSVDVSLSVTLSMWIIFCWFLSGFLITTFLWYDAKLFEWSTFCHHFSNAYSFPRVVFVTLLCIALPVLAFFVAWRETSVKNLRKRFFYKISKKFGG